MRRCLVMIFFLFVTGVARADHPPALDIVCDLWPPYQTRDRDETLAGFSTEVVKAVLARMDVRINVLEAHPWKRALRYLQTNRFHALFSANFIPERTEFAWYPKVALIDSPWVIWVKQGSGNSYRGFDDLKGKTVGIVRGYSYTDEFREFIETHNAYEQVHSDEMNFRKLHYGRLDYVAAELRNGFTLLNTLGYRNIIPITTHPIKSDGLFMIFNKTAVSQAFVARFSRELAEFKKQPAFQALMDTYFNF